MASRGGPTCAWPATTYSPSGNSTGGGRPLGMRTASPFAAKAASGNAADEFTSTTSHGSPCSSGRGLAGSGCVFTALDGSRSVAEYAVRVLADGVVQHTPGDGVARRVVVNVGALCRHSPVFRHIAGLSPAQFSLSTESPGVKGRCDPSLLSECLSVRNIQRLVLLANNPRAFVNAVPKRRGSRSDTVVTTPACREPMAAVPEQEELPLSKADVLAAVDKLRSKVCSHVLMSAVLLGAGGRPHADRAGGDVVRGRL